jgi:hypothetical protein
MIETPVEATARFLREVDEWKRYVEVAKIQKQG